MGYEPEMQNAHFWRKNENKFGFGAILYYLCTLIRETYVYFIDSIAGGVWCGADSGGNVSVAGVRHSRRVRVCKFGGERGGGIPEVGTRVSVGRARDIGGVHRADSGGDIRLCQKPCD